MACAPLAEATKRRPHMHKGKTVYFWEQTVDDVNIYIPLPAKVPRKHQTAPIPPPS